MEYFCRYQRSVVEQQLFLDFFDFLISFSTQLFINFSILIPTLSLKSLRTLLFLIFSIYRVFYDTTYNNTIIQYLVKYINILTESLLYKIRFIFIVFN